MYKYFSNFKNPIIFCAYGMLFCFGLDFFLSTLDYFGNEDNLIIGFKIDQILFYLRCGVVLGMLLLFFKRNLKVYLQNLLLSFLSIIITLATVEITCGLFIRYKHHKIPQVNPTLANKSQDCILSFGPNYNPVYKLDPNLGIVPKPSQRFNWVKVCKNPQHDIYRVSFSTDQFSRRIAPRSNLLPTRYALFFGCSFTFGDGLNDNQTLPYFFQSINPTYKTYNYAFNTYTTIHMLAHLNRPSFKQEVLEKEGVAYYIYYNDHIKRNIPSMNWAHYWGGNYLSYNGEISPQTQIYKEAHPVKYWLFDLMKKSAFLNLFAIGYPLKVTKVHQKRTAEIIEMSYYSYIKKFGNKNFIVVVYPGSQLPAIVAERLAILGIKVLNFSSLFRTDQPEYWIKYDGHPSEKANKRVAEEMIKFQ